APWIKLGSEVRETSAKSPVDTLASKSFPSENLRVELCERTVVELSQLGCDSSIDEPVGIELFASLASLLRSYTAVHGLHEGIEAAIEFDPHRIMARNGEH